MVETLVLGLLNYMLRVDKIHSQSAHAVHRSR